MANTYYDKGDKVRLHASFTVDGVATDPTNITLKIKDPDDTETSFSYPGAISKGSTGYYYYDLVLPVDSTSGAWHYRFESDGVVNSAAEKTIITLASHFD